MKKDQVGAALNSVNGTAEFGFYPVLPKRVVRSPNDSPATLFGGLTARLRSVPGKEPGSIVGFRDAVAGERLSIEYDPPRRDGPQRAGVIAAIELRPYEGLSAELSWTAAAMQLLGHWLFEGESPTLNFTRKEGKWLVTLRRQIAEHA